MLQIYNAQKMENTQILISSLFVYFYIESFLWQLSATYTYVFIT